MFQGIQPRIWLHLQPAKRLSSDTGVGTETSGGKRGWARGDGASERESEAASKSSPERSSMTSRAWASCAFQPGHRQQQQQQRCLPRSSFPEAASAARDTFLEGQDKTPKGLLSPRAAAWRGLPGVAIRGALLGRGGTKALDCALPAPTRSCPFRPPWTCTDSVCISRSRDIKPAPLPRKRTSHVVMTKDCKGERDSSCAERSP